MTDLDIKEYDRRPFQVAAVEVTLENIAAVAEWCKGTIETQNVKMLGTTVKLPVIKLQGQGKDRERTFTVSVGCFVVDHKGNFRMYKPAQFHQMFIAKRPTVYRNEPGSNAEAKEFFEKAKPTTRSFTVPREDVEQACLSTGIPIFKTHPVGMDPDNNA
jgi:hypothetical protein